MPTASRTASTLVLLAIACTPPPPDLAVAEDDLTIHESYGTEQTLLLGATTATNPPSITLTFPRNRTTGEECLGYTVSRKDKGADGWTLLTTDGTLSCDTTSFTDWDVSVGQAFEYMVQRSNRLPPFYDEVWEIEYDAFCEENPQDYFCDRDELCISDPFFCDFIVPERLWSSFGFLFAGVERPDVHQRGTLVLIVDETVEAPLSYELDRYQRDLASDGWSVVRHTFGRALPRIGGDQNAYGAQVRALKALIRAEWEADPANVRAVLLFGHLPIAYSGVLWPDGHTDHIGAWPTDVYYGDMDESLWTDTTVDHTTSRQLRQRNIPGDGKFDQSYAPSEIELAVGRVDLFDLPAFAPATEIDLYRRYLDKNHAFRRGEMSMDRRALMSKTGDLRFTFRYGVDDFASYFDTDDIDVTNATSNYENSWFNRAETGSYLWGYLGYAGHWRGMHYTGTTVDFARNVNVAFLRLYGSYFGDWDLDDAFLRAPLAGPHALVSFWDKPFTGNRNFFFHMGMGDSIGEAMRFAQNEDDDYPRLCHNARHVMVTGERFIGVRDLEPARAQCPIKRPIFLNLMGDPTLRMFVVTPPSDVRAEVGEGNVRVTWTAPFDADATSAYHVYRAADPNGPFDLVTTAPVATTEWTDETPVPETAFYAVRATRLETTPSGTFWNNSHASISRCADLDACGTSRPTVSLPGIDRAAPSQTGVLPDGVADDFELRINVTGAVTRIRVQLLNHAGTPYSHLGWDTDPSTPYNALAVYEDGVSRSRPDGSLAPLSYGSHDLTLYGARGSIFIRRLMRVEIELEDGSVVVAPLVWHGPLPEVTVGVAPSSLAVDIVGAGDGFPGPDGVFDGVFDVQYTGPVERVALLGVTSIGSFNWLAYDTIVGDTPIPPALGTYPSGAWTWTVGVERAGTLLNGETGAMPRLDWTNGLRLYATDTAFQNGRMWKVVIELPDGSTTESAPFSY